MGLREEPTTTIPLNHNNTTSTDKFAIPIGKYTTHPSWEKFLVKDCNQHRSLQCDQHAENKRLWSGQP